MTTDGVGAHAQSGTPSHTTAWPSAWASVEHSCAAQPPVNRPDLWELHVLFGDIWRSEEQQRMHAWRDAFPCLQPQPELQSPAQHGAKHSADAAPHGGGTSTSAVAASALGTRPAAAAVVAGAGLQAPSVLPDDLTSAQLHLLSCTLTSIIRGQQQPTIDTDNGVRNHSLDSASIGADLGCSRATAGAAWQRLDALVQGGVPYALRGTVWKAFLLSTPSGQGRGEGEQEGDSRRYWRLVEQALGPKRGIAGSASSSPPLTPQHPPATNHLVAATALDSGNGPQTQAQTPVTATYAPAADSNCPTNGAGTPTTSIPVSDTGSPVTGLDSHFAEEGTGRFSRNGSQSVSPVRDQAAAAGLGAGAGRARTVAAGTAGEQAEAAEVGTASQTPAADQSAFNVAGHAGGTLSAHTMRQIEKDLRRTLPTHPGFTGHHVAALRRVLAAHCLAAPQVGYCQGLNFLAASLLLFMAEEDAFSCLVVLVQRIMDGCFLPGMEAMQVEVRVFEQLVRLQLPSLAQHLQGLGVDLSAMFVQWFLCLFINSLPFDACFRVWDLVLYRGSRTVLLSASLALLHMYRPALEAATDGLDAMQVLRSVASLTYDGTRLISLIGSTTSNDNIGSAVAGIDGCIRHSASGTGQTETAAAAAAAAAVGEAQVATLRQQCRAQLQREAIAGQGLDCDPGPVPAPGHRPGSAVTAQGLGALPPAAMPGAGAGAGGGSGWGSGLLRRLLQRPGQSPPPADLEFGDESELDVDGNAPLSRRGMESERRPGEVAREGETVELPLQLEQLFPSAHEDMVQEDEEQGAATNGPQWLVDVSNDGHLVMSSNSFNKAQSKRQVPHWQLLPQDSARLSRIDQELWSQLHTPQHSLVPGQEHGHSPGQGTNSANGPAVCGASRVVHRSHAAAIAHQIARSYWDLQQPGEGGEEGAGEGGGEGAGEGGGDGAGEGGGAGARNGVGQGGGLGAHGPQQTLQHTTLVQHPQAHVNGATMENQACLHEDMVCSTNGGAAAALCPARSEEWVQVPAAFTAAATGCNPRDQQARVRPLMAPQESNTIDGTTLRFYRPGATQQEREPDNTAAGMDGGTGGDTQRSPAVHAAAQQGPVDARADVPPVPCTPRRLIDDVEASGLSTHTCACGANAQHYCCQDLGSEVHSLLREASELAEQEVEPGTETDAAAAEEALGVSRVLQAHEAMQRHMQQLGYATARAGTAASTGAGRGLGASASRDHHECQDDAPSLNQQARAGCAPLRANNNSSVAKGISNADVGGGCQLLPPYCAHAHAHTHMCSCGAHVPALGAAPVGSDCSGTARLAELQARVLTMSSTSVGSVNDTCSMVQSALSHLDTELRCSMQHAPAEMAALQEVQAVGAVLSQRLQVVLSLVAQRNCAVDAMMQRQSQLVRRLAEQDDELADQCQRMHQLERILQATAKTKGGRAQPAAPAARQAAKAAGPAPVPVPAGSDTRWF